MITVTGTYQGRPTTVRWSKGVVYADEDFNLALDALLHQPSIDLTSLIEVQLPTLQNQRDSGLLIESLFDHVTTSGFMLGDWETDLEPDSIFSIGKHKAPIHPGTGTDQSVHGGTLTATVGEPRPAGLRNLPPEIEVGDTYENVDASSVDSGWLDGGFVLPPDGWDITDKTRLQPVEQAHLGECYEMSAKFALGMGEVGDYNPILVHGIIQESDYSAGTVAHGWVEFDSINAGPVIYEPTTNQVYLLDDFVDLYNPRIIQTYDYQEMQEEMVIAKVWGPWDEVSNDWYQMMHSAGQRAATESVWDETVGYEELE